jgi:peptide/nickel transport system ATP-binding protein
MTLNVGTRPRREQDEAVFENALTVRDLTVSGRGLTAVRGVSLDIPMGHRLGIVGESGAGKSLTAFGIMGLLPAGWSATGEVIHRGQNLLEMTDRGLSRVRGRTISMVFQDPLTSLNPVRRVGSQVEDVIRRHLPGVGAAEAGQRVRQLFERMHLPRIDALIRAYPHELSGGQRQRVMVAMALACAPDLIIADEPTTALDATVQKQVLRLIDGSLRERGCSLLLITHDLPIIAAMCDSVAVMYGGRIVERGPVSEVFTAPRHPYTRGLLDSQPTMDNIVDRSSRLPSIPGMVPSIQDLPSGCGFRDRCSRATDECLTTPDLIGERHEFACWNPIPTGVGLP